MTTGRAAVTASVIRDRAAGVSVQSPSPWPEVVPPTVNAGSAVTGTPARSAYGVTVARHRSAAELITWAAAKQPSSPARAAACARPRSDSGRDRSAWPACRHSFLATALACLSRITGAVSSGPAVNVSSTAWSRG